MTKEEVLKMIKTLNQKIVCQGKDYIEIENPCYGETISFIFNSKDILTEIYS